MKIGFSVADITPELGIYLTGYGHPERLANNIHLPLEATVMVLEEAGRTAAVIGMDWCFVDKIITDEIRKAIHAATQIEEKHIILCCSHTHSAPHTTHRRTLGRVSVDPESKGVKYALAQAPVIARAVKSAQSNLRECKAGFARTKTETGVSRRGTDEYGNVCDFIEDPDLMYDSNMTVAYFRDAETDEDLGILVHASAHNTATGITKDITSDWCGVMKKRLRDKYSVPVIFVNGGFGDVGPRTNRWFKGSTRSGFCAGAGGGIISAEEVGLRAASDALRALEDIRDFRSDLPLGIHVGELRLPQELPLSEAQAKACEFGEDDTRYHIYKRVAEAWKLPPEPELVEEQTLISFGPLALVPFPFEVFSIFSLRLRKYGPFEYTLAVGNTNGSYGYLPDRGAFAMGGYEPYCLAALRTYVIKPEAGDLAVVQSLAALREMKRD